MKNTDKNYREDRSDRDRTEERTSRLQFLSDVSDYKVADGDPDVRGWTVVDDRENTVGKVDNLLVDTNMEKVRYLDVELNKENLSKDYEPFTSDDPSSVHEFQKDGEYHMIVPIGLARLDKNNKRVLSEEINRRTIEQGNMYRKGESITPEFERRVVTSLRGDSPNAGRSQTGKVNQPGTAQNQTGTSQNRETRRSDIENARDPQDQHAGNQDRINPEKRRMDQDRAGKTGTSESRYRQEKEWEESERTEKQWEESDRENSKSENREMRRPSSSQDQQLSRKADRDRQNDDDFYEDEYFDDRKFYGRK